MNNMQSTFPEVANNTQQGDHDNLQQDNDLIRQMEQQLAAQQAGTMAMAAPPAGVQFGQINANMLMSAFQSAPQGQNSAEALFAHLLAATNNSGNSSSNNFINNNGINPGAQHLQSTTNQNNINLQQSTSSTQSGGQGVSSQQQNSMFAALPGLDQLQSMNQQSLQPQIAGFPGLQQQILNLQQHLGGAQHQQLPMQQNLGQQPQPQNQQAQQQPQYAQLQSQLHFPWMGQMGQNLNPAMFNTPVAFSLGAFAGSDPSSNFLNQDGFNNSNNSNNAGQMAHFGGMFGVNPVGNPFQLQPPTQQQQQFQETHPVDDGDTDGGKRKRKEKQSTLAAMLEEEQPRAKTKKPMELKKKRAKGFPEKLMEAMMQSTDEEAVAWLPDGKSFVIVNPDLFCNEVLSKVFKECKYASFVRKLHRWGFVRLTSGTGTDCYHHPQFQKNKRDMASRITCSKDKDSRSSANSKPPSLAGVEKFIRAKAAAAASAELNAEDNLMLKDQECLSGGVDSPSEPSGAELNAGDNLMLKDQEILSGGVDSPSEPGDGV